jgi:ribulose-5-phosphate 4-epimerase/fuculose-1-phosphate aldolase
VHASAGKLSVRLAGEDGADDGFLITPTDACLGTLDPARLAHVGPDGAQRSGDRASKTLALHRRLYASAPAARCVLHTHSTHLVALTLAAPGQGVWSADAILPPITPYFVMRVGKLPLVPYFKPGDPKLADAIRDYAKGHRAVLLANHGPVVAGTSLSAASASIEELEETAKLHLLLQGFKLRTLSDAQVRDVEEAYPS